MPPPELLPRAQRSGKKSRVGVRRYVIPAPPTPGPRPAAFEGPARALTLARHGLDDCKCTLAVVENADEIAVWDRAAMHRGGRDLVKAIWRLASPRTALPPVTAPPTPGPELWAVCRSATRPRSRAGVDTSPLLPWSCSTVCES
jgi:hypothetical protein